MDTKTNPDTNLQTFDETAKEDEFVLLENNKKEKKIVKLNIKLGLFSFFIILIGCFYVLRPFMF